MINFIEDGFLMIVISMEKIVFFRPDKTVPKSGLAILRKWHYIRDLGKDEPCIIHCSAGIGRTGTFVRIFENLSKLPS